MRLIKFLFYLRYIIESIGAAHKASGIVIVWLFPYYFMLIHLFLWVFKLQALTIFDNKIAMVILYLVIPIAIPIAATIILLSDRYEREIYRELLYLKISKSKIRLQVFLFLIIPITYFGIITTLKPVV